MNWVKSVVDVVKSDRFPLILFPIFTCIWLSCAMFEFSIPGVGEVTIATDNKQMPVYVGIAFGLVSLVLYLLDRYLPAARRDVPRPKTAVALTHVTRNLATRIVGPIEEDGKHWMLFEDALKKTTEHHTLPLIERDMKITGLALDVTTFAGLTERKVRESDGKTLIRSIYADDRTKME